MPTDERLQARVPPRDRLITPPPGVLGDAALDRALAEHNELAQRAADAAAQSSMLEDSRQDAVDADTQALAQALRAGESDPGGRATRFIDEKIAEARRQADALALAVRDSRDEILDRIRDAHDALAERLDKLTATENERLRAAIDAVRPLVVSRARFEAARTWVDEPQRSFRVPEPILPGMRGANDEVVLFEHAIGAMLASTRPAVVADGRDQRAWREATAA
jgi:hypothetical protein